MTGNNQDRPQMYEPTLSNREFSLQISMLGIKKANNKIWQLFVLGMLAGLYISFGGQVFLVALEQGMSILTGGAVSSIGLVLVVIAGAELFTGNIIMLVGAVTRQFPFLRLVRNWLIVYLGNFSGSYLFALAIFYAGLLGTHTAPTALGMLAASIAETKISLSFSECIIRGMLCNMLVILAIIMATMAKDIISKIVCCVLPIMVFVACGFEHCVANMFLIPAGLLIDGVPPAGQLLMFKNIIPVTLGNILGGVLILFIHPNRVRQLKYLLARAPAVPAGANPASGRKQTGEGTQP